MSLFRTTFRKIQMKKNYEHFQIFQLIAPLIPNKSRSININKKLPYVRKTGKPYYFSLNAINLFSLEEQFKVKAKWTNLDTCPVRIYTQCP